MRPTFDAPADALAWTDGGIPGDALVKTHVQRHNLTPPIFDADGGPGGNRWDYLTVGDARGMPGVAGDADAHALVGYQDYLLRPPTSARFERYCETVRDADGSS